MSMNKGGGQGETREQIPLQDASLDSMYSSSPVLAYSTTLESSLVQEWDGTGWGWDMNGYCIACTMGAKAFLSTTQCGVVWCDVV